MTLVLLVLVLVQWLHILCGIIWFGGYIFLDFAVWPALLRRPAAEAQAASESLGKASQPLMILGGNTVVLLGILRGTLLGPIKSFAFLFGSAYGFTWLAALVLALALSYWRGQLAYPLAGTHLGRRPHPGWSRAAHPCGRRCRHDRLWVDPGLYDAHGRGAIAAIAQ